MGVPKSTAQMLKEIQSGTAAEVILDARALNHPFGPTFLPQLDGCLATARPHAGESRLERGDLIEIAGPSGSGKTTIAIFLLMTSLLPSTWTVHYPNPTCIDIGGRNQHAALIYPITHSSPLPLLRQRMYGHIRNSITTQMGQVAIKPELERQIETLVKESLGRLKVVRVKPRWKALSLALKSLLDPTAPAHLQSDSGVGGRGVESEEGGMDLVVCDGFGDGFWPERWHDEQRQKQRHAPGTGQGKRIIGLRGGDDIGLHDVLDDISKLRKHLGSVIVLTIQGLYGPGPFYTTHLPPPYPNPFGRDRDSTPSPPGQSLNIQISLHGRVRPLQEPPDRTLLEALNTRDSSHEAQSRKYEGVVRVVDHDGRVGDLGGMKFSWTRGPFGVHVWED